MKIVTTSGDQLNCPDRAATPDDAINLDGLIAQCGQALEEWHARRTVTPSEGQAPRLAEAEAISAAGSPSHEAEEDHPQG